MEKGDKTSVDVLCLLGETPQVLTELCWGLARRDGVAVGRLAVVTTTRGLARLVELIEGPTDPAQRRQEARTAGRLRQLWGELGWTGPAVLTIHLLPSDDAGTTEENSAAGEAIDEALREAVEQAGERRLVACLSGGRKSMTAWMTTLMVLRARVDDRLVHVTVDRSLEKPGFWYPTGDEEGAKLSLAEVPFVRLSHLLPRIKISSVEQLVQEATRMTRPLLSLDETRPREVWINGEQAGKPARLLWALLLIYAERSRGGENEIGWLSDTAALDRLRLLSASKELDTSDRDDLRTVLKKHHSNLKKYLRAESTVLQAAIVGASSVEEQRYGIPEALRPYLGEIKTKES